MWFTKESLSSFSYKTKQLKDNCSTHDTHKIKIYTKINAVKITYLGKQMHMIHFQGRIRFWFYRLFKAEIISLQTCISYSCQREATAKIKMSWEFVVRWKASEKPIWTGAECWSACKRKNAFLEMRLHTKAIIYKKNNNKKTIYIHVELPLTFTQQFYLPEPQHYGDTCQLSLLKHQSFHSQATHFVISSSSKNTWTYHKTAHV